MGKETAFWELWVTMDGDERQTQACKHRVGKTYARTLACELF